jgi:phosphoadenosine phosphosulfate reductase
MTSTTTAGDSASALIAASPAGALGPRERFLAREAARTAHAEARAARGAVKRSESELRAIAARGAAELGGSGIGADDEATAEQVVAWVARELGGDLAAVACSMADAVLPHLVAQTLPFVDVLFLDTGYHFPETVGTRDAVATTMDVTVVDVLPRRTVAEQDAEHGKDLWARDPAACCAMRKVEPLTRTLAGYEVWFTGVRRDEAPTRTHTPLITFDEKNGLIKVNPLAAWSSDDLYGYAARNGVLLNPLLDDGYPSIGCAPCTRRVAPGEDPRSGRWAGFDKTECGLHT